MVLSQMRRQVKMSANKNAKLKCPQKKDTDGRIFNADGTLHNKRLVARSILFKFKMTFALANDRFPVRLETSNEWKFTR